MNKKHLKQLGAVALASTLTLSLSACSGGVEASSLGYDTPEAAAEASVKAIQDGDWDTLCGLSDIESATEVATYWIDDTDTCAGNVESVIWSEFYTPPAVFRAVQEQGAEFYWGTATVEEESATEAKVVVPYTGTEGDDTLNIYLVNTPGIGWQSESSL
ncbi:hypothetical protein Lsed01_00849 [Demequina sediminis]|uniref:Lipoprotein n=2 Tax=Demequina sediminis TaxID=1930058 RepID=A0ABP9WF37_9MICO